MSSNTCPNTCGILSTSAIFIAVGIVQLLGGVILLKSEHIYLLAGTDFIASFSNIIVGCLLGMSASSWESKMKRISVKNASRRNVLAGLYISVVAVNTTTAIIMITGDGNSLLTALAETTSSISAKFIGEILASAYVASVCSPIVCIVVGIVCLSGNRLELKDFGQTGKKQNKSISKSESYGWVFKHRPKIISDFNSLSPSLSKTSSGDCVFAENKRSVKSSLTTSDKSMKIWAQKRNKLLQEITAPRHSLFSDDYLQFPEFNYTSYMGSMLPRIKQTSLNRPHSATNSLDHSSYERTSISTSEMCMKNVCPMTIRRATINRSNQVKKKVDTTFLNNFVAKARKLSLSDQVSPTTDLSASRDEKNDISSIGSPNELSSCHTTPQNEAYRVFNGSSDFQGHSKTRNDSNNHFNNEVSAFGEDVFDYPNEPNCSNGTRTRSDSHSVSFDFEPENLINNPDINLTVNSLEQSTISQIKSKLMRSFKSIGEKEHKPAVNSQSTIPRKSYLSEEVFTFSDHCRTVTPETMAGEVIPISIQNILPSRTDSISISADELGNSKNEKIVNGELQGESRISYSEISLNDVQLNSKFKQLTNDGKENFDYELSKELQPVTQVGEKLNKSGNNSTAAESTQLENMHSVDENYSSPFQKSSNDRKSNAQGSINGKAESETTVAECKDEIKSRNKRQSTIRYPSIFTGYSKGSDGKTDISNLIMDSDSLLGLSDEDLLDRTRRLRQLRKSVEIRSKERKSVTVHSSIEE